MLVLLFTITLNNLQFVMIEISWLLYDIHIDIGLGIHPVSMMHEQMMHSFFESYYE